MNPGIDGGGFANLRAMLWDLSFSLDTRRNAAIGEWHHWRETRYRQALRMTVVESLNPADPRLPAMAQEIEALEGVVASLQEIAEELGAVFAADGQFQGFAAPEDIGVVAEEVIGEEV